MQTKTRGLEPIVAAVLLIVVAVIGVVLVYLWFSGYVTKATSQAESMAASEKLKIEAASLFSNGTAYLYIRNLGGENVTLATAYILKPGTMNPLCATSSFTIYKPDLTTTGANTLYPDALQKVKITTGCNLQSGYDYVIKVVTQKGTEFAVTATAS